MFNLAAEYERLENFPKAVKWFRYCARLRPDDPELHYGLALAHYKMGETPLNAQGKTPLEDVEVSKPEYFYLRALIYKKLQRYREAGENYQRLLDDTKKQEGKRISKYVFGLMGLLLESNRKVVMDYVEGLYDLINYYEPNRDCRLLSPLYASAENGVLSPDKKERACATLSKLSFFRRFSEERLHAVVELVRSVDVHRKDELLFLEEDVILVILRGNVLMQNH